MKKTRAEKSVQKIDVTPEQRYHIINDAAYFRGLKQKQKDGVPVDEAASWCEVEAEIDEVLKQHHAS